MKNQELEKAKHEKFAEKSAEEIKDLREKIEDLKEESASHNESVEEWKKKVNMLYQQSCSHFQCSSFNVEH